ncbi:TPA: Rha family transcriptional regulator [Salmonella enterica]|uniref:Rha family transcriptional regulator n=1 Tax=Salmonella enterica TaxID=28901 RepID=A0A744JSQ5_SALER|nr:Rha family transcriptional regulator [Salmonella enterica]EBW2365392.1 Rha family transcriptional regulator [Salmonella enterica subsp. enterica serovar Ajiobo]EDN3613742.1 Rha family transcriptional regulator [Salmonella enterica subsp. enterica serovar Durham]EEF0419250.1 Rha family transcriptional regulator [Salmonella enterica subsp. enterica serovar Kibi]EDN5728476.1 Rha family transcriptional regulator [Salmonella enterica subsp. enterica serovar Ajiobo]
MKKINALTGQGFDQPENSHTVISVPTMSSLQMVDYINTDRKAKARAEGMDFPCKKYRKLRHADFTKKVPNVLGLGYAKNFAHPFKNEQNGEEYPGYLFPKREACLMAMSYSYELQAAVYDYMEELDRQKGGYLGYTIGELQHIVACARQYSDEDSSDAGRRLRKRQDDLILLEKAEDLVSSLSQLSLNLPGNIPDAE